MVGHEPPTGKNKPETRDRPNTIHWPPILYLLTLVAAYGLDRWQPLPPLAQPPIDGLIGWPLFALGAGLGVAGLVRFRVTGTSFDPTAPADALATGGIYQLSRNPMYLGALVAFVGLGLALGLTWLVPLAVVLSVALRQLAILPEEAYLERRFGDAYRRYKSNVRRWL
jgi:protein-S-isoprenylcysteine O-methyltransferase Ste14